jgi:uncharacterized protein DUF2510
LKASRSNLPHLIAAAGGAVLVISLFLNWISIGDASASGWETFDFVDIVLFVIGISAAVVGGAHAMGAAPPVPWLRPELLKWDGVVAVTIALTFIVEGDNLAFGAFLGVLAALAILAGGILSDRPDLAARVADAAGVEDGGSRPAAKPPSGLGSGGSSTGTGSYSAGSPSVGSPGAASPGAVSAPSGSAAAPTPGTGGAPPGAGAGGVSTGSAAGAPAGGEGGGPPAGWYPDPQGQARLRYWDGGNWTDQTSA